MRGARGKTDCYYLHSTLQVVCPLLAEIGPSASDPKRTQENHNMASHNSLLLNVARNLRYRSLEPMIGQLVTISDRSRVSSESTDFVAKFTEGCSYAGPEQEYLDGQIAKYGILDLRFAAPSTLLGPSSSTGVSLLKELGFVDDSAQQLAEEFGADTAVCLEQLRDGIAKHETHLLVFLVCGNRTGADRSMADRAAHILDPSLIRFPITFTVADACVSNSASVWINKHFYL